MTTRTRVPCGEDGEEAGGHFKVIARVCGGAALFGCAALLSSSGAPRSDTWLELAIGGGSSKPLGGGTLDFWMGIALRFLAIAAVSLAVVEVELPLCDRPKWLGGVDRQDYEPLPDDVSKVPLVTKPMDKSAMFEGGVLICLYMGAAIGIVYLNAWILVAWPYPATLTCMQMTFCSLASAACVQGGLSDPWSVGMTPWLYATICLPLCFFYTLYLYGSNAVYDYLPVGYIQLLKPGQAACVYILLAMAGKEIVAYAPVLNLVVILGSVVVASVANAEIAGWSTYGFVLMMGSNAAYALYLVGQQLMLNTQLGGGGKKMDPITTLYFLGPATAIGLGIVAAATEWGKDDFSLGDANWAAVIADCLIAFSLNLIQIRIIGKLSALTYMFAGYFKGFVTVSISVAFLGEPASSLEIGGYAVMLFGQLLWSLRKLRKNIQQDPHLRAQHYQMKLAAAGGLLGLVCLYSFAIDKCALLPCIGATQI